jgi:hypothetical protein
MSKNCDAGSLIASRVIWYLRSTSLKPGLAGVMLYHAFSSKRNWLKASFIYGAFLSTKFTTTWIIVARMMVITKSTMTRDLPENLQTLNWKGCASKLRRSL